MPVILSESQEREFRVILTCIQVRDQHVSKKKTKNNGIVITYVPTTLNLIVILNVYICT